MRRMPADPALEEAAADYLAELRRAARRYRARMLGLVALRLLGRPLPSDLTKVISALSLPDLEPPLCGHVERLLVLAPR